MRYSTQIKPISYLKANAADVLEELTEQRKPLIITQNGEAKAVLQDVASYEETQETMYVLERLLEVTESLATSLERGSQPKELRSVGIQEYRQVFFKPYRAIYRVIDKQVVIYVIADGRRDMQSLLSRRLLGG